MAIYPLTRSLTFYSIGYISTHVRTHTNTATAKSRQSCPTLCDPIDSSQTKELSKNELTPQYPQHHQRKS